MHTLPYTSNNVTHLPTTHAEINQCAIIDTGATDTMLRQEDTENNPAVHTTTSPSNIDVRLPNGSALQSTHAGGITTGQVDIPTHVFPNDQLHTSLISVADYTNEHNCTVKFTKTHATVEDQHGNIVLQTTKNPEDRMWKYDLTPSTANNIVRHELNAQRVDYWHKTLGSPTHSTFAKATAKGYLRTIPQLTAKMVRQNHTTTQATAKGHLDLTRRNQRSTKPTQHTANLGTANTDNTHDEQDTQVEAADTHILTRIVDNTSHTDATGRLPKQSRKGNNYLLVSVFDNYAYTVPMASRKGSDYVKAYTKLFDHYISIGVKPTVQRLDNETSKLLTDYLQKEQHVTMEYVPPDNHRTNKAERVIRDVKNHVISMLATADPDLPFDLWDESEEQLNITINLLRPYGPNPDISAYEGVHGKTYDFNRYPMAPWGTQVLVHEGPNKRASWASHGLLGYYLGPAIGHYRCYRAFVISTNAIL